MNLSLRTVLLVSVSVVLGFAVGRYGHLAAATRRADSGISKRESPAQLVAPPKLASIGAVPVIHHSVEDIKTRSALLQWFKQTNVSTQVVPFNNDEISSVLALILGLTSGEVDDLNAALRTTRQRMAELSLQNARGELTPDGKTLVVTIPPFPAAGGAEYSKLLDSMKQVLGSDRFRLFSDLAGTWFDQSFNSFGINVVRHELSLTPANMIGGAPTYTLKTSYNDSQGSWGSISGTLSASELRRTQPAVARFFPNGILK